MTRMAKDPRSQYPGARRASTKYNVRRVLDVSSDHIPEATAAALTCQAKEKVGDIVEQTVIAAWDGYGWIVGVDDRKSMEAIGHHHPELAHLLKFAKLRDCDFLRLDVDGDELPEDAGFPLFRRKWS
jgi:hypothetical protein